MAYGAALAWCAGSNRELELPSVLDAFVFRDETRTVGALAVTLAEAYRGTGKQCLNGSPLFTELVPGGLLGSFGEVDSGRLEATLAQLEAALSALPRTRCESGDGPLVPRELASAVRLARHGAWRMALAAGLPAPSAPDLRRDLSEAIAEQRAVWLARSRPGGLVDSLSRLEATLGSY